MDHFVFFVFLVNGDGRAIKERLLQEDIAVVWRSNVYRLFKDIQKKLM